MSGNHIFIIHVHRVRVHDIDRYRDRGLGRKTCIECICIRAYDLAIATEKPDFDHVYACDHDFEVTVHVHVHDRPGVRLSNSIVAISIANIVYVRACAPHVHQICWPRDWKAGVEENLEI